MMRLEALTPGLLLVAAACATGAPTASAPLEPPPAIEEAPVHRTSGYLLFSDCSIHPDSDGSPTGLYVRGTIQDGKFFPEGGVQGQGELDTSAGTPGWLELRDARFYGAMTSRAPFTPYVEGRMQQDGAFVPSSRAIND